MGFAVVFKSYVAGNIGQWKTEKSTLKTLVKCYLCSIKP